LENNGINDAIAGRNADLNRLKGEIADVYDENHALENEKRDFTQHLLKLKDENRANAAKLDELNGEAGDLVDKKNKLEKYVKDLEFDRNKLEKQ